MRLIPYPCETCIYRNTCKFKGNHIETCTKAKKDHSPDTRTTTRGSVPLSSSGFMFPGEE